MMLHVARAGNIVTATCGKVPSSIVPSKVRMATASALPALRKHYELADDDQAPLYIISGQANLINDHPRLIAEIRLDLGADAKPAAVVLDTLNKSLHGSESKDADMGAYIRAAEAIRDAFGCVVIIVHHCGHEGTRPRGHSSLPGADDAQLAVTREGDFVKMEVEHMRDGPEGTIVTGMAKVEEVGVDAYGQGAHVPGHHSRAR